MKTATTAPKQMTLFQWIFSNTRHQNSDIITKTTGKFLHLPSHTIKVKQQLQFVLNFIPDQVLREKLPESRFFSPKQ